MSEDLLARARALLAETKLNPNALRRARKSAGMTLGHLARLAGVRVSEVSEVERGRWAPSDHLLAVYAEHCGAQCAGDFILNAERALLTTSTRTLLAEAVDTIERQGRELERARMALVAERGGR